MATPTDKKPLTPFDQARARPAPRSQQLDILRGVAILLVLGAHYDYCRIWSRLGWVGVDLFFVLSGFLISGLLFSEYKKHGQIDVKRFWIRRGFKIYPPFYALMALTVLVVAGRRLSWSRIAAELFFVQGYLPHIWVHTWSLAVEEHFYLLLPLLLAVMIRFSKDETNPFRGVPWVFIPISVTCLALRIVASLRGASWWDITFPTHMRIDSLFAGVTLGYYRHFHGDLFQRFSRWPLWLPAVILVSPAVFFPVQTSGFMHTIGFTLLFVGFGGILVWRVDRQPSRNVLARLVAGIGAYSYSIYLWHVVLASWVFRPVTPHLALFSSYVLASLLLGFCMAVLVENPSLALRDKWFPSRSAQPPTAPVSPPRSSNQPASHPLQPGQDGGSIVRSDFASGYRDLIPAPLVVARPGGGDSRRASSPAAAPRVEKNPRRRLRRWAVP